MAHRPAGRDILTAPTTSLAPLDQLSGFGSFDQDRVRIEISDGRNGDDARDITVKSFPTWGDAADLIDVMDVRPDGPLRFVGPARSDGQRPVVEGSQMLGQSIVAATRHAPERRVVSASMIFLRSADACQPLEFVLTELSAGRTFTGLAIQVLQGERCCAAGNVLLEVPSDDLIRHAVERPAVPGPYECPPYDMGVTGRDLRVADGAYSNDADEPVGPPNIDAWVRFRCRSRRPSAARRTPGPVLRPHVDCRSPTAPCRHRPGAGTPDAFHGHQCHQPVVPPRRPCR